MICVGDGEYSGSYEGSSDEDAETSPRNKILTTSKGFNDFRIKSLKLANLGRKVISIAEQGKLGSWQSMSGLRVE